MKLAFTTFLVLVWAWVVPSPAAHAQLFRGRLLRSPATTDVGYREMGCDCQHCVANRGGMTFAEMQRSAVKKVKKDPHTPTPDEVIALAIHLADLKPYDIFYDLGSGNGKVIEAAVKNSNCLTVGIEVSKTLATSSRERLSRLKGLSGRWRIVNADILTYKEGLSVATVAYMNLYPEVVKRVVPRLTGCTRIISYKHPIPGYKNRRYMTKKGPLYITTGPMRTQSAKKRVAPANLAEAVQKTIVPVPVVRACRT